MGTDNTLNELKQLLAATAQESGVGTTRQYLASVSEAVAPVAGAGTAGTISQVLYSREANSPASQTSTGSDADSLVRQLTELTEAAREQTQSTEANTQAVVENSLAKAAESSESTLESVGKSILSFLGSGFGIVQVLTKIFDRDKEEATVSASSFALPDPVSVEAGILGSTPGLLPIRYGESGIARPAAAVQQVSQTPVTIQVQALDSRSIIDHSGEIAQAVKEALLNSHSLNDVVTEI